MCIRDSHNPANKFCIISVKTADQDVPQEARSTRRYKDHLIRFVATGYELPRTDAVELELDGEWKKGKYGMQLQVEPVSYTHLDVYKRQIQYKVLEIQRVS